MVDRERAAALREETRDVDLAGLEDDPLVGPQDVALGAGSVRDAAHARLSFRSAPRDRSVTGCTEGGEDDVAGASPHLERAGRRARPDPDPCGGFDHEPQRGPDEEAHAALGEDVELVGRRRELVEVLAVAPDERPLVDRMGVGPGREAQTGRGEVPSPSGHGRKVSGGVVDAPADARACPVAELLAPPATVEVSAEAMLVEPPPIVDSMTRAMLNKPPPRTARLQVARLKRPPPITER